jgi:hypothetical protein
MSSQHRNQTQMANQSQRKSRYYRQQKAAVDQLIESKQQRMKRQKSFKVQQALNSIKSCRSR